MGEGWRSRANQGACGADAACRHYRRSDQPLFEAGYRELCRLDLAGAKVVEICCGRGELALELARTFPKADVQAWDRYPDAGHVIAKALAAREIDNVRYVCGDAFRLTGIEDCSVDLLLGQATLHHLTHDLNALNRELRRVIKPGGRVVFINEPLGHNYLVAAIRACQVSRGHLGDESNLFIETIAVLGDGFTTCRVQSFNLLGYPLKAAGWLPSGLMELTHRVDAWLMSRWQGCCRWGANINIIYEK